MIRRKFVESREKRGSQIRIAGTLDAAAFVIATAGGAGLIPFGPGTWGSLVGVGIVWVIVSSLAGDPLTLQNVLLLAALLSTGLGIIAGDRAEHIFGKKDPGQVVIDEVAGQIITFAFLPVTLSAIGPNRTWWLIPGFILFRLADIFKPYPIDRLQDLHGGFGIMMDDVLAGIYAAIALSIIIQASTWLTFIR